MATRARWGLLARRRPVMDYLRESSSSRTSPSPATTQKESICPTYAIGLPRRPTFFTKSLRQGGDCGSYRCVALSLQVIPVPEQVESRHSEHQRPQEQLTPLRRTVVVRECVE